MKRVNTALWVGNNLYTDIDFEIHFNLWRIDCVDCIDIGISYDGKCPVNKFFLYINCKDINICDIQDISSCLEDPVIAKLVFNQDVAVNSSKTSDYFSLHMKEQDYCICKNNYIKIEKKMESGIVFSVSTDNHIKYNYRNYIRLRIYGNVISKNINRQLSIEEYFEYYSLQFDTFEFRFNDKRSFLSEFSPTFPAVKKIRCFLILDSTCDIVLCNKNYKNVRILEKTDWEKYLPQLYKYKKDNFFVYQWNDGQVTKKDVEHFSIFTKIKKPTFTYNKFITILFLAFSMGVLTSLCASFLYSLLTS